MTLSVFRPRWFRFCLLIMTTALIVIASLSAAQAYTTEQYQRIARETAAEMGRLIGRSLSKPIYISTRAEDRDRLDVGEDSTAIPAVRRGGRWEDAQDDPAATTWEAYYIVLSDLTGIDDASIRSTVAHEVYHCFQYDLLGLNYSRPNWLIEGSAEWAGEAFVGGSASSYESWQAYLNTRKILYDREYDAIGLFAHLSNQGVNVWRELDDLLRSADSMGALEASVREAGEARFLQTWPMGLAREASWGGDWDTTGPGITDHRLRPTSIGSVPAEIIFSAATPGLAETRVPDGRIIEIQSNTYGALHWGRDGGTTVLLSPGFQRRYCVGESCRCRDGSSPPGVEPLEAPELTVAGVGGLRPGDNRPVNIRVETPDCEEERPDRSSGDSGGWTGRDGDRAHGTSFGDPHIITYDGYRYSFQTVGEFVLTRSLDGRFEVQVRQQPVPGRQLSMNTAVAMKIGSHRVALYAQNAPDGQTPIWLDGAPLPVGNGRFPLPDGGFLTRAETHYTVTWASGEAVQIAGVDMGGSLFFTVSPDVPRRAGQFTGLLGDLNQNPDDDLRVRGGNVLPSQDTYAPVTRLVTGLIPSPIPLDGVQSAFFQQLYRQFGDSWRITQVESLFDYGPGQSTETFTNRSFPSQFPSLAGVAPAQVQQATQLCRESGVDDWFLEGCVFDVAATGDGSFVQAAVSAIADTLLDTLQDRVVDTVEEEIRESVPIPIPIPFPRLPF